MNDKSVLQYITDLVEEERRLVADGESPEAKAEKLRHVAEQLDQCWDLLRQRRAKREFGKDPDGAEARPVDTVERYTG